MSGKHDELVIAAMNAADLEQVIALGLSTPELQDADESAFFGLETLAAWITSPHDPLLVVRRGTQVAGFAIASYHPLARVGYVYDLALDAGFRGQGLGRKLLTAVMERFRVAGAREIWCLVHEQNTVAARLFESFGLRRGRRFDLHIWLADEKQL